MNNIDWQELETRIVATIRLCLDDDVMYYVMNEESPVTVWAKLESRYISLSLSNKLYLKHKLFGLKMSEGTDLNRHVNVFNQIISDLKWIDAKFNNEDEALMLLNSLPFSLTYENLVITPMWEKETLILKKIISALLSFNLRKKTSDENSQGEGIIIRSNQKCRRNKSRNELRNNEACSKTKKRKDI